MQSESYTDPFILDLFRGTNQEDFYYHYQGVFTRSITDGILALAERSFEGRMQKAKIRKRLYFLMIESLQNITRYQAQESEIAENDGVFLIRKQGDLYFITTGNLIENQKIDYVRERIEEVNSLSAKELKNYYREKLNNGNFTDRGGGGLGLIEMARKSGNKLAYVFEKISETHSFFYLHTIIPKIDEVAHATFDLAQSLNPSIAAYKKAKERNISLVFCSDFSQESILGLLSLFERQLKHSNKLRKKIFNLLVEMLQNIIHHGCKENSHQGGSKGIFFITEDAENYFLNTGNYIESCQVPALRQQLEKINAMQAPELDDFFNRQLFDFDADTPQKSGLGFIDMRIKSKNPLSYSFSDRDAGQALFTLRVRLVKQRFV